LMIQSFRVSRERWLRLTAYLLCYVVLHFCSSGVFGLCVSG
jgi:hypothetical protein